MVWGHNWYCDCPQLQPSLVWFAFIIWHWITFFFGIYLRTFKLSSFVLFHSGPIWFNIPIQISIYLFELDTWNYFLCFSYPDCNVWCPFPFFSHFLFGTILRLYFAYLFDFLWQPVFLDCSLCFSQVVDNLASWSSFSLNLVHSEFCLQESSSCRGYMGIKFGHYDFLKFWFTYYY